MPITVIPGYLKQETENENRRVLVIFQKSPKQTAGSFHAGTSQNDCPVFRAVI